MAETVKTPAGLGLFATSPTNMAWYLKRLASRTIGPDKLNQLRHARMFGDAAAIDRHHALKSPCPLYPQSGHRSVRL